jgi:hypothetical protein
MPPSTRPGEPASRWYPRRADPRPAYRMPVELTVIGALLLGVQVLMWVVVLALG